MRSRVIEKTIQRASLIGHVVEDVVYESIEPSRFRAELVGRPATPQYKADGFFVFSDLAAGVYTLRVTGERLQTATRQVEVHAGTHVFLDSLGDDELVVIAREVEDDGEEAGGKRVTFDPVVLVRTIRAGAPVVSDGLPAGAPARLAATLEAGEVSTARIENADGLAADSIVRFIRRRSVRMSLDPYHTFASSMTRVVGKVVSQQNAARPLAGARVRVREVNGAAVTEHDVHGVAIFKGVDAGGRTVVLGAEQDVSAVTNEKGDYNLYFSSETLAGYLVTDATLQALETAGVPEKVREVLGQTPPKNKVYRGRERFLNALGEEMGRADIGNELLLKHLPLILQHAEGFIRGLTLEATLAGFEPASKSEDLSTAQRKVVNFELVKS